MKRIFRSGNDSCSGFVRSTILAALFCHFLGRMLAAEQVAFWDFSEGTQGWRTNTGIDHEHNAVDGFSFQVTSPDPFLTSPRLNCPVGGFLVVTLRMRSTGDTNGQVYFGEDFSEANSRNFVVRNDGEWHDYRISLPSPGRGSRIRLDPSSADGFVTLSRLRIEALAELPHEPWASPRELRDKKFIGGGLYTVYGEDTAITPRFLARHPEFSDAYPFDGIVLPALLSAEWVKTLGLTKMGKPMLPAFLHELLWNKVRIPDEAVAQTVTDLKSMRRGTLTDNFLIFGMIDGARGMLTPDLTKDEDWFIIEQNAKLAARICREGSLKGFWFDTEQYSYYRWRTDSGTPEIEAEKPQGLHFPLGKDSAEVLRRRGAAWIKAIQSEFPEVKIMTTFAWSPDANGYGPLTGVIPFLDGVLEGIESPGQIIHGHENTFYFGHAKGTTHTYATENGFPGDRNRYDSARSEIRGWAGLSSSPEKYNRFVHVGMAAWIEDHPWNVPDGWPVGSKASLWSNLPLALAYSDEYVWVWSEHTKYGQPHLHEMNPFLASLNNQTQNEKAELLNSFREDFTTDPMHRSWYFDFDMLSIGRTAEPEHEATVMSLDAMPYRWDREQKGISVIARNSPSLRGQRQRFVRRLPTDTQKTNFHACFDFRLDASGASDCPDIALGLFHDEQSIRDQSISLRIDGEDEAMLVLAATGASNQLLPTNFAGGVKLGVVYRFELNYTSLDQNLVATLTDLTTHATQTVSAILPARLTPLDLNEVGVAIGEESGHPSSPINEHRLVLLKAEFHLQ